MLLHREEWHVRVYQWWYDHKYKRQAWQKAKTQTNLCPYMRAVMIWAPLRAIFWDWITVAKLTPAGNLRITLNMLTIPLLMLGLPQPLGYLSYNLKILLWTFDAVIAGIVLALLLGVSLYHWIEIECQAYRKRRMSKDEIADWAAEHHLAVELNRKAHLRRQKWQKFVRFFALINEYLRSGHDRICPEIQIVDSPLPPPPSVPPADPLVQGTTYDW